MATIGYATLSIIPSLKGAQAELEKQSKSQLEAAGKTGGKQYGQQAGKSAGSSFKDQFQKNLKGLAGPVTAAFAGLGLKKVLSDSVKAFTDLNLQVVQFRRLTGGSVESASRLRTAVQLSGVDVAKATSSLVIFSKNLGKAAADETKAAATTALLGTSFVDANGQVESLVTLLPKVADKFASMEDGVAKTTLATQLFGRSGTAMIPFLNKGAAGIAELTAQSDKLGLTLSQTDLDSFSEYRAASRELQASLQGLKVQLGREVLPALTSLTSFVTENGVPALKSLGNGARDLYNIYKSLPGPVKDAAQAFILLRIASAVGLGTLAAGAVARVAAGFATLRLQVMFAGDAFTAARAKAGLFRGSLAALAVTSRAVAGAIGGVLRAALPIVALTVAISLYSKFKQRQEETKARVDALTASLEEQTGAITDATRTDVLDALVKDGTLETAKSLGVSLGLVTDAALGSSKAIASIKKEIGLGLIPAGPARDQALEFIASIEGESDALSAAQRSFQLKAEAERQSTTATEDSAAATGIAATALEGQATSMDKARTALRKLIAAEKERYDALLTTRQDALALEEQISNARDQAKDGSNKGINSRTKAGQENRGALYDLIDQFNNADPKVRNAEGNFERVRTKLLEFADSMGVGERQATRLIDELLRVPKSAPIEFQSKGYRERMREIQSLQDAIARFRRAAEARINLSPLPELGGLAPGRGSGSGVGLVTTPRRTPKIDLGSGGLNKGQTVYQYNGNVTYTDEEEGRRRAKRMDQRANGDGARRR